MARGSIRKRSKSSWTIIVDLGYRIDPETGRKKRNQKWIAVSGTKRDAEKKLAKVQHENNQGEFVEPTRMTFAEWLDYWLENRIKPGKRLRTYETYRSIAEVHLKPSLGFLPLQGLSFQHIERYYAEKTESLSAATLERHHAVLSGALGWAERKQLINRNPAKLVDNRPKAPEDKRDAKDHCWCPEDARAFLEAASRFGTQTHAFYLFALETGMRKGELCGLRWKNVDLDAGKILIDEQLVKPGPEPVFGPPKRGKARTLSISPATVNLLKQHRREQNELKMANRKFYRDKGLVFAKEWNERTRNQHYLGDPLQMNNLGQRQFAKIIKEAGVPKIKFHGLRHTCATLMLKSKGASACCFRATWPQGNSNHDGRLRPRSSRHAGGSCRGVGKHAQLVALMVDDYSTEKRKALRQFSFRSVQWI